MRRPLTLALAVVMPALLLSPAAGASSSSAYDRLYLLGADTDYLYWGADPTDPELRAPSVRRTCGTNYWIPGDNKPCLVGTNPSEGNRSYNIFFLPGSQLREKVTWSTTAPLKFHIEGNVNTFGAPYTLQLIVQKQTAIIESVPANEVSPGVWEGELTTGGPMHENQVNLITVRVETAAPAAVIDLRLGGRSYLELPRPFEISSVPDLGRADTHAPQPTSYQTPTRTFTFNDDQWAARSFTGQTGALRTFDFNMEQRAEILLMWVEVFDTAFFQDVRRGRSPDAQKVRQGAAIRLSRDGAEIDHSGFGNGIAGLGTEALAVLDLAPGPLTLEIDSANEAEEDSRPFTVHVLEVRGERTLKTMRWLFTQPQGFRVPVAALCPASPDPVPMTDEVRSVALDLDWDTEATGITRAWTVRFDLPAVGSFPCSEAGTGDEVRLTLPPAEQVFHVGATPAYNATFLSAYDTTFQMLATYTYSTPPAA